MEIHSAANNDDGGWIAICHLSLTTYIVGSGIHHLNSIPQLTRHTHTHSASYAIQIEMENNNNNYD